MNNICIVMPFNSLPVDASMGGAIEQLMKALIIENEKEKKFSFTFVTPFKCNLDAVNIKLLKKRKILKYIYMVSRRINKNISYENHYDNLIYRYIISHKFDKIIFEGFIPHNISKYEGMRNRMIFHVHHNFENKFDISKYFYKIINVSNAMQKKWKDIEMINDMDYDILRNCVSTDCFCNRISANEVDDLKAKFGIKKDEKLVLYCGRLIKEKGVLELIKAIKKINDPNIKLMIVGESIFKNSIKTSYTNLLREESKDISKNIIFTGYVDNKELYKYYFISDMQVIPSIWEEAAGIVALEGKLTGILQIVSNVGGLPEYASSDAIFIDVDNNFVDNLSCKISENIFKKHERVVVKHNIYNSKKYYEDFVKIMEG